MVDRYTLTAPARFEADIRKSRFLTKAAPVTDVDAAMAWIAQVGDPAATHNCWAYRIGQTYRFNDDGEPSSTAGKPILQAIDGQAMDHVAVVVTRWFGGIKLGAGGLVRAYGGTAAECLRRAEREPIVDTDRLSLRLTYAELPTLRSRLNDWHAVVADEAFEAMHVVVSVQLPSAQIGALRAFVADLTRGRISAADTTDD